MLDEQLEFRSHLVNVISTPVVVYVCFSPFPSELGDKTLKATDDAKTKNKTWYCSWANSKSHFYIQMNQAISHLFIHNTQILIWITINPATVKQINVYIISLSTYWDWHARKWAHATCHILWDHMCASRHTSMFWIVSA